MTDRKKEGNKLESHLLPRRDGDVPHDSGTNCGNLVSVSNGNTPATRRQQARAVRVRVGCESEYEAALRRDIVMPVCILISSRHPPVAVAPSPRRPAGDPDQTLFYCLNGSGRNPLGACFQNLHSNLPRTLLRYSTCTVYSTPTNLVHPQRPTPEDLPVLLLLLDDQA
jgi:hypothetical protein